MWGWKNEDAGGLELKVRDRSEGVWGEEGWTWEGCGEFWETGVKTETKPL